MLFEASAGIMGLHTNWHKTKIQKLELEMLQEQSILTVHIDNQAIENETTEPTISYC